VDRPVPPPVDNPVPPPVDRPVPPPVHVPRYYWQPTFPVILRNDPQPLPQIQLPPAPAPARQVGPSEVSNDVVDLLAGYGRLRKESGFLFWKTHPKIGAQEAKQDLANGQTIFLGPDGGTHLDSKAYKPINSLNQLQPMLPDLQNQKLNDLQNQENQAAQQRVNQWNETDIQNRINALPTFNSVYNMDVLNSENFMVSAGDRSFNRNLITAMNVYNQGGVKREIAENWHQNPAMSTADFNQMANRVISSHVSNLFWDASYQGDYGTYLGTNPVPGLRYPDTQEDVDYNTQVIQRVATQLPFLLNGAVNH
jgi:hypothetical protein